MKIAIQAADLDNKRIDGTRVYLLNLLKYFGKLSFQDEFFIYHGKEFNPELTPPDFLNYKIKKISAPFLWTQTRFAWELFRDRPDVLWMPMHNIPVLRSGKIKTVATIHDLAFKFFPDSFTKNDLRKLNFLTDLAIRKSDKIIAVSQSTKNDILKIYSDVKSEKIKVIYHGFDAELLQQNFSEEKVNEVFSNYKLQDTNYILYIGAIQPRKNLKTLIKAFEALKSYNHSKNSIATLVKNDKSKNLKLVLAGGKAWMWEETVRQIESSPLKDDIILTGKVSFQDLAILYQNARLFVFPSLYEGFGIPILEAFASGVPIIAARNSSLPEVGGEAVEYFDTDISDELAEKMKKVLENENLREEMIAKGKQQLQKFSWEKCARETLEYLKE